MNLNMQTAGLSKIADRVFRVRVVVEESDNLVLAGIPPEQIGIGTGEERADAQSVDGAQNEGFWRRIANFFEGKTQSADGSDYDVQPGKESPGNVLVVLNAATPQQRDKCEEILEAHNAEIEPSISEDASAKKRESVEGGQRIQLLSEVLSVQKKRVPKGEVRFRKEVVTDNQTIEVPVTREELVVERVPAQSGTAAASGAIGSSQEVRVPLSEEKVRVEKKPMVKEEVRVGKKTVQESRQVNEQVKREELHVDRKDEGAVQEPNKRSIA